MRGIPLTGQQLAALPLRLAALFQPMSILSGIADGIRSITRNFPLATALARRELTTRHSGQFLGAFWAMGQPLFLMLLYVFVFAVVFKQRIGGTFELPLDYTIYILSGLVPWLTIMPALSVTCQSVTANGQLVKQFTIDPELFPLKDVLITFVFWTVGVGVIALYTLVRYQSLPWTYVLLPVALLIQFTTAIGFGLMLSSLTVFVRDLRELVQMLTTAGMYVLPVVYLPQWVPAAFRPILYANPFSYMVWVYQDVFYFGRIEHPYAWVVSAAIACLALAFGQRIFRRLQPYFTTYL